MAERGGGGGELDPEAPSNGRPSPSWQQPSENSDWIVAHPEELAQYRGEYVAIWERRVVLHGTDPAALHQALRDSPLWDKPLLAFWVPTRDEVDSLLVL